MHRAASWEGAVRRAFRGLRPEVWESRDAWPGALCPEVSYPAALYREAACGQGKQDRGQAVCAEGAAVRCDADAAEAVPR